MEQYDIFGLMPPEEAEEFKLKPKLQLGTTLSEVQHAKEKKGLPGEYKEGWEEATGDEKSSKIPASIKSANSKSSINKNVDKTPEYLSYKKYFCYAGHQVLIEDPTLSLEGIRKRMVKMFPELSKERTEMTYTPPAIPKKAKGKKSDKGTAELESFGFEGTTSEDVAETTSETENTDAIETTLDTGDPDESKDQEENNESKDIKSTVELSEKSETKIELLPSVIDGVELFGMVVPILKGARKGAIREEDMTRIYSDWNDLIERPTVRNLFLAHDGLYEVRITQVGIFKVRLMEGVTDLAAEINEGVDLLLPLIPQDLFLAIRDFFVRFALLGEPLEVLARIYYDGSKYFAHVPHQKVSWDRVSVLDHPEDLKVAAQNTLVMELHSHNVMSGVFSEIDDRDELATGIYWVLGNLDRLEEKKGTISGRYSCAGHYRPLNIGDYLKRESTPRQLPSKQEIEQWIARVHPVGRR